jgi:hypothetical protein
LRELIESSVGEINSEVRRLGIGSSIVKYELAARLYAVKKRELWKEPDLCLFAEAYPGFNEWVYAEVGLDVRTVRYYIRLVEMMMNLELGQNTIAKLITLGWVKSYHLLRSAVTEGDLLDMLEDTSGYSEVELKKYTKLRLEGGEDVLDRPRKFTVIFDSKSEFEFFMRAKRAYEESKGEVTSGGVHAGRFVSLLSANYLSTLNGGAALEAEERIRTFESLFQSQYGVSITVVVNDAMDSPETA